MEAGVTLHLETETRLKPSAVRDVEGDIDPGLAPALPEADLPMGRSVAVLGRLATRRGSAFGRLARWVFGSLFTLILTAWARNFITGLFAANPWLGWAAGGLTVAALTIVTVYAAGEVLAFRRLGQLDALRAAVRSCASAACTARARKASSWPRRRKARTSPAA
jgi:putative membrane protein